ncbi:MAG: ATP-binding protein [Candidatus Acidiferrales bacterium]
MRNDPTFLGLVRKVSGARLFVELSPDIPSASPIIEGRVYRLGQVGSFVRIPLGFLSLYGVVSMVGASEWLGNREIEYETEIPPGQRWMEVQLVGESYGKSPFERGVSVFPTIDDEVHVVTETDLTVIYGSSRGAPVQIGYHASSVSLPAVVDLESIVTRHAAVVGSTGSGKSNAIAALLKNLCGSEYPRARVVVIDPHSEYGAAFRGISRVFRIGGTEQPLLVPYWTMSFDEFGWFFVDRKTGSESVPDATLRDKLFEMRKAKVSSLRAGALGADEITVDSPVPFNIRDLWWQMDFADRATFKTKEFKKGDEEVVDKGDAETLKPATFKPVAPGDKPPYKNPVSGMMQSYLSRISARLKDKRFEFLCNAGEYDGCKLDLHDLLASWIAHPQPLTVFDLGGIPFEVADLVVGLIARVLFEISFWGRDLPGIGRQAPILIVFEEAHSYLPRGQRRFVQGFALSAVQRIFKEGRKYGVGAIVVSQRPSELDETVLSQCGTFFALRLSNSEDQGRIKTVVPDSLAGLIDLLPALRTGESLVLGEAVPIPSRVRFALVEPRPRSDDPDVGKRWKEPRPTEVPYAEAVSGWRTQSQAAAPESGGEGEGKDG